MSEINAKWHLANKVNIANMEKLVEFLTIFWFSVVLYLTEVDRLHFFCYIKMLQLCVTVENVL